MYAHPTISPESTLKNAKAPSGAFYTLPGTDGGPDRNRSCHPLLTPMTGASLFMSLSAYNTAGIGMLSTVFSMITGTVGLWGLWTVRPIISSSVAVADTGFTRSSSPALGDTQNSGQTSVRLPSYSATNPPRPKSRKARRRSNPKLRSF